MTPPVQLLAINAALTIAAFILLWLINLRVRDPSFVDAWWPLGMVLTAIVSFALVGGGGARRLALTLLTAAWGGRLGVHLLVRWRRQGPDPRYAAMMAEAQVKHGWSYAFASLVVVFALQGPLQWLVCLPVQLGQIGAPARLGWVGLIGAGLAAVGIGFESIGDWQLTRFKADPANAGTVMQAGLWRYTRHPNYFGEACVWWGLFLIAAEAPLGLWSLPGPLLITFLLTRFSGVPTVEGRMRETRPGYADYVRRTSGFLPLPPRKR
ncbi:MAG TPA: DUF1295 domain-containing protein [Caulobacteraceae bacterium]|jgi:steroid 5-alpha reductase family enzyme|nr:DUF1295 domain-containing protein [Caulobacteraceae bacterium]